MGYTKVNYADVEPVADGMHFMRDALDCSNLGVTVIDCEPEWTGKEHDHGDNGQEEVYVLVEGGATIEVEGENVAMDPGDALRVSSESRRQIYNDDTPSTLVVVGAP